MSADGATAEPALEVLQSADRALRRRPCKQIGSPDVIRQWPRLTRPDLDGIRRNQHNGSRPDRIGQRFDPCPLYVVESVPSDCDPGSGGLECINAEHRDFRCGPMTLPGAFKVVPLFFCSSGPNSAPTNACQPHRADGSRRQQQSGPPSIKMSDGTPLSSADTTKAAARNTTALASMIAGVANLGLITGLLIGTCCRPV